jgi:hypothetical protein
MRLMNIRAALILGIYAVLWGGPKAFAGGVCEEFQEYPTSSGMACLNVYYIPWVAFGGGWKTTLRGANLSEEATKGKVQFMLLLSPADGDYAPDGHSQYLYAIFINNKATPPSALWIGTGAGTWVDPGGSVELNLLYTPAGCDKYGQNCQSMPDPNDGLSAGSAVVGYFMYVADGAPAALRGLPKPSAQFNHVSGLQATEPAFTPAPLWRVPVSATADRKKEFMFAMGNAYAEDIVVRGTLINQDGKTLGVQTWTIPGHNTKALYLTNDKNAPVPGLGSDPFPDGKDCTAWLELRVLSPASGLIAIVGLQATNGVMSSADIQPFYPK